MWSIGTSIELDQVKYNDIISEIEEKEKKKSPKKSPKKTNTVHNNTNNNSSNNNNNDNNNSDTNMTNNNINNSSSLYRGLGSSLVNQLEYKVKFLTLMKCDENKLVERCNHDNPGLNLKGPDDPLYINSFRKAYISGMYAHHYQYVLFCNQLHWGTGGYGYKGYGGDVPGKSTPIQLIDLYNRIPKNNWKIINDLWKKKEQQTRELLKRKNERRNSDGDINNNKSIDEQIEQSIGTTPQRLPGSQININFSNNNNNDINTNNVNNNSNITNNTNDMVNNTNNLNNLVNNQNNLNDNNNNGNGNDELKEEKNDEKMTKSPPNKKQKINENNNNNNNANRGNSLIILPENATKNTVLE